MTVDSLDNLANKLLTKFGIDFDIHEEILGDYNLDLGEYEKTEIVSYGKCAFLKSDIFDFNGSFVLADDEKLLIYSSSNPINKNTYFEINSKKYSINKTIEIIFKNDIIIYKSILKEKKDGTD